MSDYQIMRGIHGTRLLASVYADVVLRKKKIVRRRFRVRYYGKRGDSRWKPWADGEHDTALMLRLDGKSDAEIAQQLKRTIPAIQRKIGYGSTVRQRAA
jgi:hypothetical protein